MIVFLDTETGGLDPQRDELIEIAWQVEDEKKVHSIVVPHRPDRVGEEAAKINRYYERGLNDKDRWATEEEVQEFWNVLSGATLCGANVAFDAAFLASWDDTSQPPWHYRTLDIESMAYAVLGPKPDGKPMGMKDISDILRTQHGRDIPVPDHTAAGDVRALVASYEALQDIMSYC